MSITININDLEFETRQKIHTDLELKLEDNKYAKGQSRYVYPYELDGNDLHLPFAYAVRGLKLERPVRNSFPVMNVSFEGTLRGEQLELKKEALEHINKRGSVMISAYTGMGKTCMSIDLACAIRLKTLIVVNKLVLMKQWEESILKFCPDARVQRLTPKCKKKDADFYIMNAINIEKIGRTFFSDIGLCIVDEAHLIMAERLSKSLQYIHPRYLIGLTATPYRPDGLNILLDLYFGKYKVIRKLYREHTVYRIDTGFKPRIEKNAAGRLDWNAVLESQAEDHDRNELIIRIIKKYKDRVFMVLVKRVAQGEHLEARLNEEDEHVTSLLGTNQEFDKKARILIGTTSKLSTGFDHAIMDTLLLATDLQEYYIQALGRIFRRRDTHPMVFDLVDKNRVLEKHYETRRQVYLESGGTITNLRI